MRILFGHAPQTALQPEVLPGGGAVVHAAAWWGSVMPCPGNMRPCCGGQVFPGARSDASLWGACCAWNSGVAIIIWGSHNNDKNQCQPGAHKSWDWQYEVAQICGDHVAPAHRQWRKLVETEPERGCQMGQRLAAHTTARSKQPLSPTDFSLQITDLMCESVSPMQPT